MGLRWIAAFAAVLLLLPTAAGAKARTDQTFQFPDGKPVRIIVFRPDVKVGSLTAGGVEEPNSDWTATARDQLLTALSRNQAASGNDIIVLPEQEGEKATVVADYQSLFRAVAAAAVQYNFVGQKLPTKGKAFDWTLGPGASQLGDIGGGNYALFLFTHDAFGTAGRKVMQFLMAGIAGVGIQAGVHLSYAALVDLSTGKLVWFNVNPLAGGDPRTPEGAAKRIDQLLGTMPRQHGAAVKTAAAR